MAVNRWTILAVLFAARVTMAFQFQSVAALSPAIIAARGLGLAEIGTLIGLYLAPGILVAIPGGAVAARFGEKRVICLAMSLMLAGGALIALDPSWQAAVIGRVLSGAGGVIVNIVLTKLLVDWFAGREISTAMGVFITSWPVGIALALLLLPPAALAGGLALAWWLTCALVAAGLVAFALVFRPAPGAVAAGGVRPARLPLYPLLLAALIWALYNSALAMVFSFGPALLIQKGWSLAAAGSATSAFMVVFSVALPMGGLIVDRFGYRDTVIAVSLASFALVMPLVAYGPGSAVTTLFVAVGAIFALAAGPIMTLPAAVLPAQARTFGMGLFFSVYYAVLMVAPRIGGGLADRAGDTGVAVLLGVGMCVASLVGLGLFRRSLAGRPVAGG